jgi:hypothetical protein
MMSATYPLSTRYFFAHFRLKCATTIEREFIAMWHTSRGDRTLRGQEALLVQTSIDIMVDALLVHIDEEFEDAAADCESGVAVYDALSASQRIALLHDVAKYLLTDTETTLPLSAPLEATIAAIFVEVRDQVAIEIDFLSGGDNPEPAWRRAVLAAYRSIVLAPDDEYVAGEFIEMDLPDESCDEIHAWEYLVDGLTDAILWDRDFEMADGFLDVDPGVSNQRRRLLGISEDYFTSIAPDPRPDEVFHLISRTRDIVRAKPR